MTADHAGQTGGEREVLAAVLNLPQRLKAHRAVHKLSLRDVGAATGLSFATVQRIEQGADYQVSNLIALLEWIER